MNFIINLMGKVIAIFDVETMRVIAIIEKDYGLIRYILKILRKYELSKTKDGYLLFENKTGEVYLHRVIMEYYSQYNDKLYTILNNTEQYEINHKNKNKWDNRLENLEMVTKLGNQLHKNNKKYSEEIVVSTEELLEIKKQHINIKDKKYLEKVNALNLNLLKRCDWGCKTELYDNLYIRFNNKIIHTIQTSIETISINTLEIFNNIIFKCIKNTFFNINNIQILVIMYDMYRCNNILKQNLKLIFKYLNNTTFRDILKKYNLLNQKYITEIDLKNKSIRLDFDINGVSLSHNILIDLFCYMLPTPLQITFYKNHLFVSASVKDITITRGKYKSFKVLYLLGLLNRQRVPIKNKRYYKNKINTVSAFLIPEYTEELFSSTILPRAEQIKEMDLSKITYTIVARNFGFDVADLVFKNSKLKSKAVSDFSTIDDILAVLSTSDTLREKISLYGFITSNDVRYELQLLNEQREENNLPFRRILDSDTHFVTSMLRNIIEIRDLLSNLDLEYIKLNKATIQRIKRFQKNNGIEDVTLVVNQTKIVRKDLIVRNII